LPSIGSSGTCSDLADDFKPATISPDLVWGDPNQDEENNTNNKKKQTDAFITCLLDSDD